MSCNIELNSCFVQKHDSVVIPVLNDPQLQNAAFSVIEAAKSQLAELKLADLFSQQLIGDKKDQFISEFIYHWAGVETKPPESMVIASKRQLRTVVHDFLTSNQLSAMKVLEIIEPLLPFLTSQSDIDEFSVFLNKGISTSTSENIIEAVDDCNDEPRPENNDHYQSILDKRRKDVQKAFSECIGSGNGLNLSELAQQSHMSTTCGVFGSENPITNETDDEQNESH